MKNLTKKLLAALLTLLMVAALMPVTASADQNAIIIVELNEPYYGENLNEILPEIKMEVSYPFIDGYAFVVYYAHTSDEDAYAAAEALATNSRVKSATYCPGNPTENTSRVRFHITISEDYFGEDYYTPITSVELGKLFPNRVIKRARKWGFRNFDIFFDIGSSEDWYEIYDELKSNPFILSFHTFDMGGSGKAVTIGTLAVTTKAEHTENEIIGLYADLGAYEVVESYSAHYFKFNIRDRSLRGTLEAVKALKNDPDVANVVWTDTIGFPTVMPKELEEADFLAPERPEATVETALGALRIAAKLGEAKNGVYDYKLADAIWQFDCDGDKAITVSDALILLRKAAKLA
ncbi:MAG: hypothetical protein J5441_07785 [Clostridia bacterium]|nr:hypothetical protein [Clostridia bacterium]